MKKSKIEIKWGLIFSVVGLLWMLLEKLVGLHSTHIDKHLYLTNLFSIPAIIIMVMALKDKKKNYFGGKMTYKQGLISGIVLSVIIALLSPLTQWITSTIITPEYFPNVIAYSLEIGYHKSLGEAESYFNLENFMTQGAIGALAMGAITTAIAMIFIRTK
jgi:beta-lactamase regulating signal transducer with metallopeptidase domain